MDKVQGFFKKVKWDSIIIATLTIVFGILCVAMPTRAGDVLCIVFGAMLLTMSVALFVRFFTVDRFFGANLLIAAAVMLILGIFCLVYTSTLQSILTVLFGIFIFVDSMTSLTDSILCAKAKIKGWWVLFVLSILTACLGVCVVFSNFDTVIIFAGCSLIIEGLRRLVTTLVFSHKIKQAKKQLTQTQNDNPDEIVIEQQNFNKKRATRSFFVF